MKKMKRFEDGGDVDYDKDSDAEAQKVFRSDGMTEVTRSTPSAKPAAKKAAPKRGTKGHRDYFNAADPDMIVRGVRDDDGSYDRKELRRTMIDDGSYDRKEQRNAMMSGFGPNGRAPKAKVDDSREFRRLPSYKKGGSVGSASGRADGIASRGKTKGRMI